MNSTFSGVEISKRALFAQTRNFNAAGHNISNLNTEGYSKQRVELAATYSLSAPGMGRAETPGQIGQGVDIVQMRRQRNVLLDNNIIAQAHKEGFWQKRNEYTQRLSEIYNEVGDSSIRTVFDKYWASWQEVSAFPEQISSRIVLLERTETLTAAVKDRYDQLMQVRTMLDDEVEMSVLQINEYITDIAALNKEIEQSRALGDDPNDLLDRRDLLIDKLSVMINITVDRRDRDELFIHTDGQIIVQGDITRPLELIRDANNATTHTVIWADTRDTIESKGGSLISLIKVRDEDVREELQKLNTLSITLMDSTNTLHRSGISLNSNVGGNFFVETPSVLNAQGNYDSDQNAAFNQSWIYSIRGENELDMTEQVGFSGIMRLPGAVGDDTVQVAYNGTDTVENIVNRINGSAAEIVATLDADSRLVLRATNASDIDNPDFVIRGLEDSGEFLAGFSGILSAPGQQGAYTWQVADAVDGLAANSYGVAPFLDPSASMQINPLISNDVREIAAAKPSQDGIGDVGDGRIALSIANLRTQYMGLPEVRSFDDYFADTVASISSKAQEATIRKETQELIMDKMRDERASVSGVNLDEEMQNILKFQAAYQAAARFLTYVNTTYETLLNMV